MLAVEYKKKADAKIHYNSFKSAQRKALPYIQRLDTHVAQKACYVVLPARNSCIQRVIPGPNKMYDKYVDQGGQGTHRDPYKVFVKADGERGDEVITSEEGKTAKQRALYAISKKAGAIGEYLNLTNNESLEVIIKAKYKTRSDEKTVQLELWYYYGNGTGTDEHGNGYIIKIKKGRLDPEAPDGINHVREAKMVRDATNNQEYDLRHAERFGETILDETYREGKDINSNVRSDTDIEGKHFDAYTKLAGEGARFECVREHMDSIREDTYFCSGANAITFEKLWQNWRDIFDMKYNIPTAAVKEFLDTAWTGGIPAYSEVEGKYAVVYDDKTYYYYSDKNVKITVGGKNRNLVGKNNIKSLHFKRDDSQFVWTVGKIGKRNELVRPCSEDAHKIELS